MSRGAHGRGGPPPDPNALRRDRDSAEWEVLPARREGTVPAWPLIRPTKRELALWAGEWERPQAVVWERNGQELEVALYVRSVAVAEKPSASVAARTLVRQQQEALGLSTAGMARYRWRIGGEPAAPRRASVRSIRDRFEVVAGGTAAVEHHNEGGPDGDQ